MNEKNKNTRKNRIYNLICEFTKKISSDNLNERKQIGFSATEIALSVKVDRANVSRELNNLVKEEKIIKVLGKPVLYLQKDILENVLNKNINKCVFTNKEEFIKILNQNRNTYNNDLSNSAGTKTEEVIIKEKSNNKHKNKDLVSKIFNSIIGANYSLKNQIKQAIAAIMYPPNGLHTLLIGPTGVGKTTFAEIMYRYAVESGILTQKSPYVIFNCADYAGNPQLLLSYLFGHVKGAFTGADRDKSGIIDSADGGILFLDEVHRLPPEGQEMLFSLMDRGKFRRLGESNNIHEAKVLIIAATTEELDKAILNTFLRRIPCVIKIPGLLERPLKERMELVCSFFEDESKKIKLPVTVSTEVLKLFLLYDCLGNIGQLKSDIQITCANAFVEYVTENKDKIYIKLSQMTDRFREGIFTLDKKREEIIQNFDLDKFKELTFYGENFTRDDNLKKIIINDDYRTEEDFYESILNRSREYFEQGKPIEEIKKIINNQVEEYFNKHGLPKDMIKDEENNLILFKVVPKRIVDAVKSILSEVSHDLNIFIDQKIIYSLSLHIETLIERIKTGSHIYNKDILTDSAKFLEEYKTSEIVRDKLEKELNIKIPKEEAAFIAMFLYALKTNSSECNISILVLAHGDSTASSMAKVANELLQIDNVKAIDMPLTETVNETLNKTIEVVKKLNNKKGVLLLVDMGSLATFSETIAERTGIPTKTVKMVTTPMVIEAARKAMVPNMDLDSLVEEVKNSSIFIGQGIEVNNELNNAEDNKCVHVQQGEYDYFDYDKDKMMNLLEGVLTFLNPKKAYLLLDKVYSKILEDLKIQKDRGLKIKFIFHCMSMIERVICNEAFQYNNLRNLVESKNNILENVKLNFKVIENAFGITIQESEFAYIVEMLDIYM